MRRPQSEAAWTAGADAYLRGEPLPLNESLDFIGGYKWAEQTSRRDWWAWTVALSIAAILMLSGIGALSIAWWLT